MLKYLNARKLYRNLAYKENGRIVDWKGSHPRVCVTQGVSILRNFKMVYVETSKICCTSIKLYLALLDTYPSVGNKLRNIIKNDGKGIHHKKLGLFIKSHSISKTKLFDILTGQEYFKFAFVRNPYDRLVSAYLDKVKDVTIRHPKSKVYRKIAGEIAGFSGCDIENIRFEDFIDYISVQKNQDLDRHWYPQADSIWFNHLDYDFIGRFENFNEDMECILLKNNVSESVIKACLTSKLNSTGIRELKLYDKALADKVYKMYSKDFLNFNYAYDSWEQY